MTTASTTAAITKTRNSIDDILAEDSPPENMLSEAEIKTMIKELVTEARRGGKVGMFKMAAAAIGGAAALKILSQMFGGGAEGEWYPDLDKIGLGADHLERHPPRRADFGPTAPGLGPDGRYIAPDREDF